MTAAVAELYQVEVELGGTRVLSEVNARAAAGALIGLCGPNGAGKTTLIRVILGLIRPTAGRVRVLGRDPAAGPAARRCIGYLPQVSGLDTNFPLTVGDLVSLGLISSRPLPSSRRGAAAAAETEVAACLDRLGIADLRHRLLRELSGGQLQLALLARALVRRPRLLLLDEPLTGLDAARQARFYPRLRDWQRQLRFTVIVVCHELRALAAHVDELWCLDQQLHVHDLNQPGRRAAWGGGGPAAAPACLIDPMLAGGEGGNGATGGR